MARTEYLTGQQAAAYCGRSDEWLRRKVNAGVIPYYIDPLNGRKVYSRRALDRVIAPVSVEKFLNIKSI